MTDFDAGGFSAVAAFFGERDSKDTPSEHPSEPRDSGSKGGRRSRLGLGAASQGTVVRQSSKGGLATHGIGKTVLRVGRGSRKGRIGCGRGGDDDDGEGGDERVEEREEGDDDEEGRTSIKPRPKRKLDATAIVGGKEKVKKKRKKPGKKERLAAATNAVEIGDALTKLPVESAEDDSCKPIEESTNCVVDEVVEEDDKEKMVATEPKKTKRKKPKVRSRQKNIRKDNRLTQNKPEHLVLGRPNYAGRALTPETRARLKLPESKTSRRARNRDDVGGNESPSAGVLKDASQEIGLGLAVDDLLDVGVAADGMPESFEGNVPKPNNRKNKRKKKSKYKNLA